MKDQLFYDFFNVLCVGHVLDSIILHGILLKHVRIMLTCNLL